MQVDQPPKLVLDVAEKITAALLEGRNEDARTHFGRMMKIVVSGSKMKRVWAEVLTLYGAPKDADSLHFKRFGTKWRLMRFLNFQRGRALLTMQLDEQGTCTGLTLAVASVPDDYPEVISE